MVSFRGARKQNQTAREKKSKSKKNKNEMTTGTKTKPKKKKKERERDFPFLLTWHEEALNSVPVWESADSVRHPGVTTNFPHSPFFSSCCFAPLTHTPTLARVFCFSPPFLSFLLPFPYLFCSFSLSPPPTASQSSKHNECLPVCQGERVGTFE